ncbi:MAG: tRNA pseudouridine(38-40) synthase TruA [Pseudomonadota bacterium]|nr:tRNA pseudouridine(38-40) synthase TruA [Pseudomonadota bacterium]
MRVALGVAYRGSAYHGWQSQPGGQTVQDRVDAALSAFADKPVRCVCAGRTDAGVHALNQVIHFDTSLTRSDDAWVRGTNRFLPDDIAIQWCRFVPDAFHSRANAIGRRYVYVLLESRIRPALERGQVGWSYRPLEAEAMRAAAHRLVGEHNFTAFRSAECQAPSPVKTLRRLDVSRRGDYWRFDFDGDAFLHHMIRNIMGGLVAVGSGARDAQWMSDVLASKDRSLAAATFAPDGLHFVGPYYDPIHAIPDRTPVMSWLP